VFFARVGPAALASRSLQDFVAELPGLRDGDERAIHQTRVAIRRVGEAVALARAEYDEDQLTAIEGRIVRMFRALGDARDADSAYRLVQHLESRFPLAAGTLGHLRASAARSCARTLLAGPVICVSRCIEPAGCTFRAYAPARGGKRGRQS